MNEMSWTCVHRRKNLQTCTREWMKSERKFVVLKNKLRKVKNDIREIKKEFLQAKTSTLLRQIALSLERALKITMIGCIPTLVPIYYDEKRGCWIDYELEQVEAREVWQMASFEVQLEVQQRIGMSLDEKLLCDLQRIDFYNMKEDGGYNQIDHLRTQLGENVVDHTFRVSLLDACPSELFSNREIVKELMGRLL